MEREPVNAAVVMKRQVFIRAIWLTFFFCAALSTTPASYFRAGAVGPDGFPDMWTGQAFIHPNTGPWVLHLWASAIADNSPPVWEFTYGYLVHCAGDVFAHDWVNNYAGRAFPSMLEVTSNPALLQVIARHLAIETTLDNRLSVSDPSISIPHPIRARQDGACPGGAAGRHEPLDPALRFALLGERAE